MNTLRLALFSLILLVGVAPASQAHTFSTSFINLKAQADGLQVRWQLTFHDLLALNQSWMPEDRISGELLNQNLDKLQHFVQRRVLVSNEEATCELELNNGSPWSTITFAREQYIVLSMTSDCQPDSFSKLVIDGVWQELPDHKIIVEGDVLGNVPRHVLDQNTPQFTR